MTHFTVEAEHVVLLVSPGSGGAVSEEQLGTTSVSAPLCHWSRPETTVPLQDHCPSSGYTVSQHVQKLVLRLLQFLLSLHALVVTLLSLSCSHPFTPAKLCAAVEEAKVHAAEHTLQTLGLQTEGAADTSCATAAAVASVAFPGT